MEEEFDEFGIPIKKQENIVDEFGIPIRKKETISKEKSTNIPQKNNDGVISGADLMDNNIQKIGADFKIPTTVKKDLITEKLKKQQPLLTKLRPTKEDEVLMENEYKSKAMVTKEEENSLLKSIEDDDKDKGFWNTVKQGIATIWNNAYGPKYDFAMETDNLKESRLEAEKKLKQAKVKITPQVLKEETYKIELDKRKDNLLGIKTEKFVEELEDNKRWDVKGYFKEKFKVELDKKNKQTIGLSLELDDIDKQLNILDDDLRQIKQNLDESKDTESENYFVDFYNKRQQELQSLVLAKNEKIEKLNNITQERSTKENELLLFRKNYNDWENAIGRFSTGFANAGLNVAYLLNEVNQLNPKYKLGSLALEKEISNTKKFVDSKRSLLKRDIDASELSLNNAFEWGTNVLMDQASTVAILAGTGGAGLGILSASEAGQQAFEIDEMDKERGAETDLLKKWSSIGLSGAVTFLSERITFGQLNKMKRVFDPNTDLFRLKSTAKEYLKDNYKGYFKDVTEETVSEFSEQLGSNMIDKFILGKEVSLVDGIDANLLLSSAFMANAFKVPALFRDISRATLSKDYNQKIGENNSKILKYRNSTFNPDINEVEKKSIEDKIENLISENNQILEKSHKEIAALDSGKKTKLLEIEKEVYDYRKQFKEIQNGNLDEDSKKDLLEDIKTNINDLIDQKESIVNFKSTVSPITKDFTEALGTAEDISDVIQGVNKVNVDGADILMKSEGDKLVLESIEVDEKNRGNKVAENALNKVVSLADEKGLDIALNVVPKDETVDRERLIKLYESVGFELLDGNRMERIANKEIPQKTTINETETSTEKGKEQEVLSVENQEGKTEPKLVTETIDSGNNFTYNNERGVITKKGDIIVFESDKNIVDLGTQEDLQNTTLEDIGIKEVSLPNVVVNTDNTVVVDGVTYRNKYSKPEIAIDTDKNGNAVVTLENEKGQNRTFRGDSGRLIAEGIQKIVQVPNETVQPTQQIEETVVEETVQPKKKSQRLIRQEKRNQRLKAEALAKEEAELKAEAYVQFKEEFKQKSKEQKEKEGITLKIGKRSPKYFVTKYDDGLLVLDEKGNEPSKNTALKVERKYAETVDFTLGKVAPKTDISEDQISSYIAENSENAAEIANEILVLKESLNTDAETLVEYKTFAISQLIRNNIDEQSFNDADNGVKTDIKGSTKRQFFAKKGEKGTSLDVIAQEISDTFGIDVSEQDIVDYVKDREKGSSNLFKEVSQNKLIEFSNKLTPLETKFTQLTGLKPKQSYLELAVNQDIRKELANSSLDLMTEDELIDLYLEQELFKQTQNEKQDDQNTEITSEGKDVTRPKKRPEPKKENGTVAKKEVVLEDAEKLKSLAEKIRSLKIKSPGAQSNIAGIPIFLYNQSLETIALALEAGKSLSDAIKEAIKKNKLKDQKGFNQEEYISNITETLGDEFVSEVKQEFKKPKKPKKKNLGKTLTKISERFLKADNDRLVNEYIETYKLNVSEFKEDDKLKRVAEALGSVEYEKRRQQTVYDNAVKFVDVAGIFGAYKATRDGSIDKLDSKHAVLAIILERQGKETVEFSNMFKNDKDYNDSMNDLFDFFEEVFNDYALAATNAGQGISMIGFLHQKADFVKYDLSNQIALEIQRNGGITEERLREITERDAKIKELNEKIAELESEKDKREAQESFDNIIEFEKLANAQKPKKQRRKISEEKAKRERELAQKMKVKYLGAFNDATRVFEMLADKDMYELLSIKLEKAGGSILNFADDVVETFGELSRKYIPEMYKAVGGKEDTSLLDTTPKKIKVEKGKIIISRSVLVELVEEGFTDINEVASVIRDRNLDILENFTIREIRDAITNYGKTIELDQSDISTTIRKMKRLGVLFSKIEDARKGKRPLRTGLKRDVTTSEERQYNTLLNDLLDKLPIDDVDLEKRIKTALDKRETTLRNAIEDVQLQINNLKRNERLVKEKKTNNEIKRLEAILDAKKLELDEVVGKPQKSFEQRIQTRKNQIINQIKKIQDNLAKGNIRFKERGEPVSNEEIQSKLAELAVLKETLNEVRESEGIIEEQRLRTYKNAIDRAISDRQKRIKEKNFVKKVRKPLKEDDELIKKRREYQRLTELYDIEAEKFRLKNRDFKEKAKDVFLAAINSFRAIVLNFEFSFIGVQGLPLMIDKTFTRRNISNLSDKIKTIDKSHFKNLRSSINASNDILKSIESYKVFYNAMGSLVSRENQKNYELDLKNDPFYDLAKKYKVVLIETETGFQDEHFVGTDFINDVSNILITKPTKLAEQIIRKRLLKIKPEISLKEQDTIIADLLIQLNPIKALERTNARFLNELRIVAFKTGYEAIELSGKTEESNPKDYEALGSMVNTVTGTANLHPVLQQSIPVLNLIFLAFRFSVSMANQSVLAPYYFYTIRGQDGKISYAQKRYAKLMAKTYGGMMAGTLAMYIASLFAWEDDDERGDKNKPYIEFDPRSSDFGAVVQGNTSVNFLGSRKKHIVLVSRIFNGKYKNSKRELVETGGGFGKRTDFDIATDYVVNHANVLTRYGINYLRGQDEVISGEERRVIKFGQDVEFVGFKDQLLSTRPIIYDTYSELMENDPYMLKTLMFASFFGQQTSIYERKQSNKRKNLTIFDELSNEVENLTIDFKNILKK